MLLLVGLEPAHGVPAGVNHGIAIALGSSSGCHGMGRSSSGSGFARAGGLVVLCRHGRVHATRVRVCGKSSGRVVVHHGQQHFLVGRRDVAHVARAVVVGGLDAGGGHVWRSSVVRVLAKCGRREGLEGRCGRGVGVGVGVGGGRV